MPKGKFVLSFSWKPEKKAIKDAIRKEASDKKVKQLEYLEAELNRKSA